MMKGTELIELIEAQGVDKRVLVLDVSGGPVVRAVVDVDSFEDALLLVMEERAHPHPTRGPTHKGS